MDLQFYKTSTPRNALEKTLTDNIIVAGDFNGVADIINPRLKVAGNGLEIYNYAYIPDFQRYYFIEEIEITRRGLYTIQLHCDVLMTYRKNIKQLHGIVTRGENVNPYYDNYITAADVRKTHDIIQFDNNFNEAGTIILVGARGVIN